MTCEHKIGIAKVMFHCTHYNALTVYEEASKIYEREIDEAFTAYQKVLETATDDYEEEENNV